MVKEVEVYKTVLYICFYPLGIYHVIEDGILALRSVSDTKTLRANVNT